MTLIQLGQSQRMLQTIHQQRAARTKLVEWSSLIRLIMEIKIGFTEGEKPKSFEDESAVEVKTFTLRASVLIILVIIPAFMQRQRGQSAQPNCYAR